MTWHTPLLFQDKDTNFLQKSGLLLRFLHLIKSTIFWVGHLQTVHTLALLVLRHRLGDWLSFTAVHDLKTRVQACLSFALLPESSFVLFCCCLFCPEQRSAPFILIHTLIPKQKLCHLFKSIAPTLSLNWSRYVVAVDSRMYWCLCRFLGWLPNRADREAVCPFKWNSMNIWWAAETHYLLPPMHTHITPMTPAVLCLP